MSLDDQTSRLDQANGDTADVVAMAGACQAQQQRVLTALTAAPRPWWRFWGR